jgi:serine/threonine protein kinase
VGGKYRLGRKIGRGSFGDIYHGKSASKLINFVQMFQISGAPAIVWLPLLGVYSLRKRIGMVALPLCIDLHKGGHSHRQISIRGVK